MTNFYEKNLKAIRDRTPDFAKLIEVDQGVDWVNEYNDSIVIRTSSNPVQVSSKEDSIEKAKENDLHNDSVSIIFGAGAGHFTRAILDIMKPRHAVVLVEPVLAVLKIALKLNDFSESIKKGSLLFACTREDIDYQLTLLEHGKNINQWFLPIEDYTKFRPNEYVFLLQHTLMMITQLQSNSGTVASNGHLIAKNDILNLPYIIKHRGVAELKNIFKDKPAILVSTGPSLQKNIHLLMDKNVQERFIIIAVGQALRILLSYDIKPDFICSVDYGPVNFGHYSGLLDIADIPLVSINRTYQPILKHWKGPKFISVSLDSYQSGTLAEFLTHKGGLLQGGSVAHMNVGLAIQLGCNPIIMVGQDLAYDDYDRSHHNLTDEAGKVEIDENGRITWKVDDPRSEIQGDHNMGPVQYVNGYYGKPVRTNAGYVSFISTFERIFRSFPDVKFINATEGGAKLEGTEMMTLEEVIEIEDFDYTTTRKLFPNKSILKPLMSEAPNAKELVSKSLELMKKDMGDLKDIIKYSQQSLNLLRYLKGKNTNRETFRKRIKENFELTVKVKQLVDKNPLLAMSVFWAGKTISQNRYSQARQEIKDALNEEKKNDVEFFYTKTGREVLDIRIEANEIVMKASNKIAKELLKDYEKTLVEMEYLNEHEELKPFKSINPEPHLDDAEEYFKNGNWGHNLIEANRILKSYPSEYLSEYLCGNLVSTRNKKIDGTIGIDLKCLELRKETVDQAKENYDRQSKDKIIKYNHYLDLAYKASSNNSEGKEKKRDFQKSIGYLLKAQEYDPDRPEVKWGMATTYHGLGDLYREQGDLTESAAMQDRSIQMYKELIEEYPKNLQFKFELGIVYLRVGFGKNADEMFNQVFAATEHYDWFLKNLAELYLKAGMIEEAKVSIDLYCEKFDFDLEGSKLKEEIYGRI